MSQFDTPQGVLLARRSWQTTLGYGPAEVAMCHMNLPLARDVLGVELTDRIVTDSLFGFLGDAEDWNA